MSVEGISSDEIAQYDRQIRLWGLDAQKRLRRANVLVAGLGGLGSEVVKNIVLAGIHSITLMDSRDVTEDDLTSQLLINPSHLGRNIAKSSQARTQELNPNVIVAVECDDVQKKEKTFFDGFDVVCLTRCTKSERIEINKICREKGILFFCGDVHGYFGYFFSDLGTHEFVIEVPSKKKDSDDTPPSKKAKMEEESMLSVKKVIQFCDYEQAVKEDWSKRTRKELRHSSQVYFIIIIIDNFHAEYHRLPVISDAETLLAIKAKVLADNGMKDTFVKDEFASLCASVLSPVAAIVAGVLAQEVIKAISMKGQPHDNFFFFDGLNHVGVVDKVCPKPS